MCASRSGAINDGLVVCCSPVGIRFSRYYINVGKKQALGTPCTLEKMLRGIAHCLFFSGAAHIALRAAVRVVTKEICPFFGKTKQNKTKQKQIKLTRRSREMFCGFLKGLRSMQTKLNFVSLKVIDQA